MSVNYTNLQLVGGTGPGRNLYRYDTTDSLMTVDTANYFNNATGDQNLAVGDIVELVVWNTAIGTGTISYVHRLIVSNTVPVTASSSAGAVNTAEVVYSGQKISTVD